MMQDALVQEDYDAIRTTGHRMKGLAGSFGFPDIGAVGQRLEQAARSRDRAAIRRELDGLATILAGVDQAA
jgi:two-component system sensor histidine kinase/response regulator